TRLYSPLGPVIAPILVPEIVTWTSGSPLPTDASVMRPLTVPVAAWAASAKGVTNAIAKRIAPRRTRVGIIRGSPRAVGKQVPNVSKGYSVGQGQLQPRKSQMRGSRSLDLRCEGLAPGVYAADVSHL